MSLAPFRQSALVRSLNIFNPPNCQTFDSTFGFYRLFCSFKFYELHLFYSFRSLFGGIFFQQLKRLESKIRNVKNKFYDSIAMLCRNEALQWTTTSFDFHQMAVHKRTTMLAHCNLKQNMLLCSKQSSFFSFYVLPSGGKSKDTVVH